MDGSTAQLVQAMASFGGAAADISNTIPLGAGAETSEQESSGAGGEAGSRGGLDQQEPD
jgi:hypothetical protein